MTYRHFIFDIDGTLLDTEQTGMLSLRQTIKEFTGKELSIPELLPYFGLPSSKTSQILGLADKNRFAEVWETHFQELMYLVTIFPGMEEILQKLKDEKCHLGIVTSRSRVEFDYDPNLKKIAHFFDCAICSDDTLRHKPFPDPVLEYFHDDRRSDVIRKVCNDLDRLSVISLLRQCIHIQFQHIFMDHRDIIPL